MPECCAECGAPNGEWIIRSDEDAAKFLIYKPLTGEHFTPSGRAIRLSEVPDEFADPPQIKVVLVTQQSTGKKLCQRCFLLTVNKGIRQRKPQPGQMALFDE